jgi:hypothetical protein
MTVRKNNMTIFDIKALRKEVTNQYLNKGYSGDKLESALRNDPRFPKDRLIVVTGYDLENNKVFGLFGNKKCEATISQAAVNKGEEIVAQQTVSDKTQSPNSWMGHKIDENMAKSIPVNSELILQESVIDKKGPVISLVASRIIKVASKDNIFQNIFSMRSQDTPGNSRKPKN